VLASCAAVRCWRARKQGSEEVQDEAGHTLLLPQAARPPDPPAWWPEVVARSSSPTARGGEAWSLVRRRATEAGGGARLPVCCRAAEVGWDANGHRSDEAQGKEEDNIGESGTHMN
jgi:hypothetical protein